LIREIHVYGQSLEVCKKELSKTQHQGLGKNLIKIAKEIALKNNYKKLAVISAIGTRQYYEKNGFSLLNLYQICNL
jgi:elongator complex protein 3